ncbi:MAG TPA: helix-turn-helix transcriptional regulator [Pseudolabrys sp.]
MARTFASPRHKVLGVLLAERRKAAGLRQIDLAKRLRRGQDYVSDVETGQKILGVIELLEWADAIGFDAGDTIKRLYKTAKK